MDTKQTLYVGTYSHPSLFEEDKGFAGRGEGVYELLFDEDAGTLSLQRVHHGLLNASYLALSRDGNRLYCVHELDTFGGVSGGGVSAYAVDAGDMLTRINAQPTHGGAPCHVAVHPSGALLTVANYSGGSVSTFAVDGNGALGEAQVIRHAGQGPNAERQEAPHVHSTIFTPDGAHVVAADLGTDTLTAYPVQAGRLGETPAAVAKSQPGDGPRMCAYHPTQPILYTVCEMTCRIALFACEQGIPVRQIGSVLTVPEGTDLTGSTASDLRVSADGRFLYASTRGHDGLSVFAIDDAGSLSLLQTIPSGGQVPRGFTLSPSGRWLLCGNQDSHTITVFAIDKEKGTLAQRSVLDLPSPVCLVFAP